MSGKIQAYFAELTEPTAKERSSSSTRFFEDSDDSQGGSSLRLNRTATFSEYVSTPAGYMRGQLLRVLRSNWFEAMMAGIITFNFGLVIHETDLTGQCVEDQLESCPALHAPFLQHCNIVLLVVYVVEILVRMLAEGLKFFVGMWNLFDFVIVATSLLGEFLPGGTNGSITFLRIFRLMRVFRAMRFLSHSNTFRELYLIIHGFVSAMRAIFWAALFLVFLLTLWSIIAVALIHPLNQELDQAGTYAGICVRCPRAFRSVFSSNLTLFKTVVAGDSWGEIAVPMIENNPETIFIFAGVTFTVGCGLLNLITAVIVDTAAEARVNDAALMLKAKEKKHMKAQKYFVRLCRDFDTDLSGYISKQELIDGFQTNIEFGNALKLLDVGEDDIHCLWNIMDENRDGRVTYHEFASQLYSMKEKESRAMLMFIKSYVLDIRHDVKQQLQLFLSKLELDSPKEGTLTGKCPAPNSAAWPDDVEFASKNSAADSSEEAEGPPTVTTQLVPLCVEEPAIVARRRSSSAQQVPGGLEQVVQEAMEPQSDLCSLPPAVFGEVCETAIGAQLERKMPSLARLGGMKLELDNMRHRLDQTLNGLIAIVEKKVGHQVALLASTDDLLFSLGKSFGGMSAMSPLPTEQALPNNSLGQIVSGQEGLPGLQSVGAEFASLRRSLGDFSSQLSEWVTPSVMDDNLFKTDRKVHSNTDDEVVVMEEESRADRHPPNLAAFEENFEAPLAGAIPGM